MVGAFESDLISILMAGGHECVNQAAVTLGIQRLQLLGDKGLCIDSHARRIVDNNDQLTVVSRFSVRAASI